jgi:uncharacterized protein YndB with AHSA1/START domain
MNGDSVAPVVRAAWVERTPEDAFAVFTDEIGAWWPLPTHGLFGDASGGVSFRDGQLIEHSIDGRETTWGEVLSWEPPTRLVVSWHPGRSRDDASEVEVTFEADGTGTRVVLEHRGWERFGIEGAARRRSYQGPNAWGSVLDHFADGAEPVGAFDPTALEAAYDDFFAEVEQGGFGPGAADEWNADEVVAHVGLNDAAMAAVCQSIVHQRTPRFDNEHCQTPAALTARISSCGDRSELVARGRQQAAQLIAALRRLSNEQLDTMVDCHLVDNGHVMLDDARPWATIAEIQASRHLPAHTAQLSALRSAH